MKELEKQQKEVSQVDARLTFFEVEGARNVVIVSFVCVKIDNRCRSLSFSRRTNKVIVILNCSMILVGMCVRYVYVVTNQLPTPNHPVLIPFQLKTIGLFCVSCICRPSPVLVLMEDRRTQDRGGAVKIQPTWTVETDGMLGLVTWIPRNFFFQLFAFSEPYEDR